MPRRRYSEADLRAMIPLYLDGALDPAERQAVEAYWAEHPEALAEFASSTRLIDVLDEAVTAPPAPDDFTAAVMDQVDRLTWFGRLRQAVGLNPPLDRIRWGAEFAMLVLVGFLLVTHPWAPSVSPIELQMHGSERWLADQPTSLRLVARNRAADKPVVSGDVSVRLQGPRFRETIFRGRTNEQGTVDAALNLPEHLPAGRYSVITEVNAPSGRAVAWDGVTVVAPAEVTIDPVRPTVAVGTELVARLTVQESDGQPSRRPVDWRLTDQFGTQLAAGQQLLAPGGQTFLRIPIGDGAPAGDATLWAGSGGVMSHAPVRLVPAVRQDYVVTLDPATATPLTGRTLQGSVQVATDSGAPVAAAQVAVRLDDAFGHGLRRSVTVNAAGRSDFRIPTGSLRSGPVTLRANARTPDGRGGVAARRLRLSDAPVNLRLSGTDGAVGGLRNRLGILLSEPWSGTAQATLNGQDAVAVRFREGSATVRLSPRSGWNRLTLSRDGAPAQAVRFRAADPRQALRVETVDAAEPGGDVIVRVAATVRLSQVYLDLVQDGQLLATRSLNPTGGTGTLVLRLPAGLRGESWLFAYAPTGNRWLVGQTRLDLRPEPQSSLTMVEQPDDHGVRVTGPTGARLLVSATRPPATVKPSPADPSSTGFLGYTLSSNSVPAAQQRALRAQRQFFDHSSLLGGVMAMLILIALTAWVYQQFTDPMEFVTRSERRRWGRVPQVHRRGTWAGLGVLAAGLVLATIVSGGLLLAGRQARELASQTGRAATHSGPPPILPARRSAILVRSMLRQAAPAHPAPDLARQTLCFSDDPSPSWPARDAATWAVEAHALTTSGRPLSEQLLADEPGELTVRIESPAELRIGETATVPVVVANPSAAPLPLAVTATPTSGLELTVAPTQRVIVEPRSELRLGIGVRAAEYGDCRLDVEASGQDGVATDSVAVQVLPDAPRVRRQWTGWISHDTDLTIDYPEGASARRLQVECLQEPLQVWTDALQTAASRPVSDLVGVASAADARALVLRLGRASDRLSDDQDAASERNLVIAVQRLLSYAQRGPDGTLSGAFAAQPGGDDDLFGTAWSLIVLRRADRLSPVDPLVMQRARTWLRQAMESHLDRPVTPTATEQPTDSGAAALAVAALALTNGDEDDQAAVDRVLDRLADQAGLLQDTTTLAWVTEAMVYERPRSGATAELLERLATLRNQRADGSNWYPGAAPTLAGATGRGAAIEVTARAALAFGRADTQAGARDEGLAYLAAQQLDDGTWGDAFLTALVVRSQMAGRNLPAAARGFVACSLDGDSLGRATFDGHAADLVVSQAPDARPHQLRLRYLGRGQAGYRVTVAYTLSGPSEQADGLTAKVSAPKVNVTPRGTLALDLTIANPASVPIAAVVAEFTVPAGFTVAGEPDAGPVLQLPIGTLQPGQSRTVTVNLRASAESADLRSRPILVRALRDPSRSARTAITGLRIS